jgi:hypothetical protein
LAAVDRPAWPGGPAGAKLLDDAGEAGGSEGAAADLGNLGDHFATSPLAIVSISLAIVSKLRVLCFGRAVEADSSGGTPISK